MKFKHFLLCIIACICYNNSYSQVQRLADDFTYDNAGNRIKREYGCYIVASKNGGESEHPVDTLAFAVPKSELKVKAYPNPTADEMIVENSSWTNEQMATVKIFDIAGRLIESRDFSAAKQQFSLGRLSPGVYQVHYYLNRSIITTWKIIKK